MCTLPVVLQELGSKGGGLVPTAQHPSAHTPPSSRGLSLAYSLRKMSERYRVGGGVQKGTRSPRSRREVRCVCTWVSCVREAYDWGVCRRSPQWLHASGTPLILFLCTPPWPLGEGCGRPAWSGATGRALSRLEHMHGSFMTGAAPRLGTAPCLPAPRKPSPCSSPRSARFSLKSFSPHRHNHWV